MEKSKKRDEKSGGEGKEEVKEEEACVYIHIEWPIVPPDPPVLPPVLQQIDII